MIFLNVSQFFLGVKGVIYPLRWEPKSRLVPNLLEGIVSDSGTVKEIEKKNT